MNTYVKWNNNKEHRFGADVSATTCFFMEEPDPEDKEAKPVLRTEIALHETPLIVNDTVWYIRPSSVILRMVRSMLIILWLSEERNLSI